MSFTWEVCETHYVTTADEAINFELEDQGKLHQEIAMDLEKSRRGDSKLFQWEEIQNYSNKKKQRDQI